MAVSAVKKEPAKSKQGEPAPAAEAPAASPSGKKGRKLLYIVLALVLLGAGSGGAWWYMHRDAGLAAHKAELPKPPVFAPLDMFTVNLQPEDVQQFAQVGLTLRLADESAVATLKLRMPEVRDRILLMLSAKKPSELISLEGKRRLSTEIQDAVNEILVPGAAKAQHAAERAAAGALAAAKPAAAAPGESRDTAAPEPAQDAPTAAQDPAAADPAQEPAAIAPTLPVTGVLFTSFIIQ